MPSPFPGIDPYLGLAEKDFFRSRETNPNIFQEET
jgi:hypothetical protein